MAAVCLMWLAVLLLSWPRIVRADPPRVHAIVDAHLILGGGEELSEGTVVLRDGRIVGVGPTDDVKVPPDARIWDGSEWWVYPGFIEPYLLIEIESQATDEDQDSVAHDKLRPEFRAVDELSLAEKKRESLRATGFTVAAMVPAGGVLRGSVALVGLGDRGHEASILSGNAAMAAAFRSGAWRDRVYPNSVMGSVAALRQAILDARHHAADLEHYRRRSQERERPAYDAAALALGPVSRREQPLLLDPEGIVMLAHSHRLARELELDVVLLGSGNEWRRPDLLPRDGSAVILPVDFPDPPEVSEESDWIQVDLDELRAWDWGPENPAVLAGLDVPFAFSTEGLDKPEHLWKKLRQARDRGLGENSAIAALTTVPAHIYRMDDRLGRIAPGFVGNLTILRDGRLLEEKAELALSFIDGDPYFPPQESEDPKGEEPSQESTGQKAEDQTRARIARAPLDDRGPYAEPRALLLRGATLWTCGPQEILEDHDILVRDGRIEAIGRSLKAPADGMIVEANGRHVTPGLIDAHSHIAAVGPINESTHSCTAEVRIRDVLDSEDRAIYEQLAGGLTSAHVMHGSANAIGGQCQLIKLRWGGAPDDLIFEGGRPTIKFALGENPKRANVPSNWTQRYPATRMGVEDVVGERFNAALEYAREWERWTKTEAGAPPRRDLQLEALLEILRDERDIHAHSYRQDEILTLMRVMEDYEARVAVFQHILEGYKVADEMAAHGAAGSSFADWWAYKFEVYDAIPQNTSIMHERGVVVSVNSDSADLARRLNTEAAKSVRYGRSSEQEALKFVTLFPARQLGVAHRVGSLEVGKDADLVLWSGHPLATASVCDQTWIEGKLYFDRSLDQERRRKIREEYEALLALARAEGAEAEKNEREQASLRGETPYRYEEPVELRWSKRDRGCLGSDHLRAQGQQ